VDHYPHQFSGGMRQRVMIAMTLSMEPELIIADEPTTALDVTVQAQILDLLAEIRADTGAGLILITHDLAVVSEVADHIVVMRDGDLVEQGTAERIFTDPQAPYTRMLLDAVPRIDDEIGLLRTLTEEAR
jgi:peptide/nickel transport system ATP-binding protein